LPREKQIIMGILEVVQESPFGVTLEEIVKKTGHHRNTVKKYLDKLKELGFVEYRKVGYYTLVYSMAIYEFITYDYSSLFLNSLIYALVNKFNFSLEDIKSFSKEIYYYFGEEIRDIIIQGLLRVHGKVRELADIPIPLPIPKIKFRIRSMEMNDKLLYFELMDIKVIKCGAEEACAFFQGYLRGLLDAIEIPYDKIELVEEKKEGSLVSCRYIAILNKTLQEIMEGLREKIDKRN